MFTDALGKNVTIMKAEEESGSSSEANNSYIQYRNHR